MGPQSPDGLAVSNKNAAPPHSARSTVLHTECAFAVQTAGQASKAEGDFSRMMKMNSGNRHSTGGSLIFELRQLRFKI